MDKTILSNTRKVVKPGDTLYILGDFTILNTNRWQAIQSYIEQIPGKKVLILGNHDYLKPFKYIELGFHSVHTSLSINIDGYNVIMNHDPAAFCMLPSDCIFLCGHIHNLFKVLKDERTINVGVDVWDFIPINFETILGALK